MSEVVYLAIPQRVHEQACEWIARLDAGLADHQKIELRKWLAEHPSHPEALARMGALWDDMAIMEELSTLFPLPRRQSSHVMSRWLAPVAAACGIVAVLVTAGIWFAGNNTGTEPREDVAQAQYEGHFETGIGEQSTAMLPDGSSISLNTNTSVDVVYSNKERRIVMNRGETLYQVVQDPSRPFNVHAAGHVVQAVGTAFDVHLKANQVDVMVTKGVVKVLFASTPAIPRAYAGNMDMHPEEAILRVGDSAAFVPHQFTAETTRRLDPHAMELRLSWQAGMLAFENEPLSNVLAEVSRYTQIELIAGPGIGDVKVGGYFKAGDIDGLLVALKNNFDIDAERSPGNKIVLTRQ